MQAWIDLRENYIFISISASISFDGQSICNSDTVISILFIVTERHLFLNLYSIYYVKCFYLSFVYFKRLLLFLKLFNKIKRVNLPNYRIHVGYSSSKRVYFILNKLLLAASLALLQRACLLFYTSVIVYSKFHDVELGSQNVKA